MLFSLMGKYEKKLSIFSLMNLFLSEHLTREVNLIQEKTTQINDAMMHKAFYPRVIWAIMTQQSVTIL